MLHPGGTSSRQARRSSTSASKSADRQHAGPVRSTSDSGKYYTRSGDCRIRSKSRTTRNTPTPRKHRAEKKIPSLTCFFIAPAGNSPPVAGRCLRNSAIGTQPPHIVAEPYLFHQGVRRLPYNTLLKAYGPQAETQGLYAPYYSFDR